MPNKQIDLEELLSSLSPDLHDQDGVLLVQASDLEKAGWSEDPTTGKVILVDGLEVPNPMPIAPPVGFEPSPSIEELVKRAIASQLHAMGVGDDQVIDTLEDAEDFDIPDELPPLETAYEVLAMQQEAPPIPKEPPAPPPAPEPPPAPPAPPAS